MFVLNTPASDAFVEKVIELAKTLRTGDDAGGDKPTAMPVCDLGPQIDEVQFKKIMDYITTGKSEGARCLLGGDRIGSKGYYIEPTIFADVEDSMVIAKEEIFGPVMQLMKFKTNEEAVERANSSSYGLAAGVCSRDIGNALAMANELDAGTVWVNCYDNCECLPSICPRFESFCFELLTKQYYL